MIFAVNWLNTAKVNQYRGQINKFQRHASYQKIDHRFNACTGYCVVVSSGKTRSFQIYALRLNEKQTLFTIYAPKALKWG